MQQPYDVLRQPTTKLPMQCGKWQTTGGTTVELKEINAGYSTVVIDQSWGFDNMTEIIMMSDSYRELGNFCIELADQMEQS